MVSQSHNVATDSPGESVARRASIYLATKPRIRLALLLSTPLGWLVTIYIVALSLLLVTAFWSVDSFTGEVSRELTFDNLRDVFTGSLYRAVTLRTVGVALAVTIIDVALALPIALYMAKVASPRLRRALVVAVLMPLWASYLVKVYAWRSVLSGEGILQWILEPFGLETPGYGLPGVILALSYLLLPYVILRIFAGLERVPNNILEASSDLGGKPASTLRLIVLPMVWPAIIAGSIFSFSLSLGDYITVNIVGGANQMLGNLVYTNIGAANNLPLAAAIGLVPLLIIFSYLALARSTGALKNL